MMRGKMMKKREYVPMILPPIILQVLCPCKAHGAPMPQYDTAISSVQSSGGQEMRLRRYMAERTMMANGSVGCYNTRDVQRL